MISAPIQKAIERIRIFEPVDIYTETKGPLISINSLTTKAGNFYEKLRYMVDYKEEHTIRRSAIERIIKRSVLMGKSNATGGVGSTLLLELVGARYLPNNRISESVANDIQLIVDKYLELQKHTEVERPTVISLAATEVDRLLFPQIIDESIVESFYETVVPHVNYAGNVEDGTLNTQTYIACRRSLLADDPEMLLYALVLRGIPPLATVTGNKEEITTISSRFASAVSEAKSASAHSLSFKISAKLRNHAIYFRVVRELIQKYKSDTKVLSENDERLEDEVRRILGSRYEKQSTSLRKSGFRAVSYIFLTKIVLAFLIEFPYEKYIVGSIDYLALGTNVIFHPLLLLLIVKSAKIPDEKNTAAIVGGVKHILNGRDIKPIHLKASKRGLVISTFFVLFYAILYAVSFGAILYILNALNFNVASIALFLFFISIVSYFGFRLRYNAQKWTVARGEERVLVLLWDFFTFPIIRTGRWLSRKFSTINVFVLILDFIIETPFKFILGTFDSFVHYLRERKEDPL